MQPESLKLTIKRKRKTFVRNSLTTANHLSSVEGEFCLPNDAKVQSRPTNYSQQKGMLANSSTVDEEKSSENYQDQLVICNPSANVAVETGIVPNPVGHRSSSPIRQHPRVYPSVRAFTVQCANCYKWRIIPTKEKYEEIRQHILEVPFYCKTGQEWRPNLSCDDPPDVTQGGSSRWAIDKPNISLPPPGFQRILKFRCVGSTKFADVYYIAPLGQRLRSTVEAASFLNEHPEYVKQGVDLSQFSFLTPRPFRDKSVKKRRARASKGTSINGKADWQFSSPGYSESPGLCLETRRSKKTRPHLNRGAAPSLSLETHVPKKKKTSSLRRCSSWFKAGDTV